MARGDVNGMLTVAGRPKGLGGSPRSAAPVSERQQLALVMQMTGNVQSGSGSPSRSSGSASPSHFQHQQTHGTPTSSRGGCWRNERGETSLHVAAIRGDLRQVQRLLSQGADPNCTDFAGWTPLHEACNRGWESVAKCLIDAGASVDARGLDDETPLHDAAVNGHANLVMVLLERGANTTLRNRRGKTAADVAAPGVISLFSEFSDGEHSNVNGIGILKTNSDDKSSTGSLHFSCASSYEACGAPCEMRRTPPQNKVDKLASPRVTLRLHQVKSRDEKKPPQTKPDVTTHDSRVQFTVKMDAGGNKADDIYEFKSNKEATPARGTNAAPDADKSMVSSKTNKESEMRESTASGGNTEQHSTDSTTRDEKLKSVDVEIGKRSHAEANDGEDGDDENRRKKRREDRPDNSKEMSRSTGLTGRPPGRSLTSDRCPKGTGPAGKNSGIASTVGGKSGSGSGTSGGNTPTDRKSPNASTSPGASPMPARVGAESGESEGEEGRRGEGGTGGGGPKVPPLKIVIPQQNASGAEGTDQGGRNNGKNGSTRHHHHHSALPYVVSSGGSSEPERTDPPSSSSSAPNSSGTPSSATSQPSSGSSSESGSTGRDALSSGSGSNSKGDEKKDAATLSEERSQRVLRSSHRMANMHSSSSSSSIPIPPNPSQPPTSAATALPPSATTTSAAPTVPVVPATSVPNGPPASTLNPSPSNLSETPPESAPSTPPASNNGSSCTVKIDEKPVPAVPPPSTTTSVVGSGVEDQAQRQSPSLQQSQSSQGQLVTQPSQPSAVQLPQSQQQQPPIQQQQPQPQQSSTSNVDVHPRKRKLKKESSDTTMDIPSGTVSEVHPHDQPITNCYELFLNIRKQIERRRKGLFPVQPKPPQGFKDYLMNRCTYVLAGNPTSRLSVPITPPPQTLPTPMKELFQEQEKERYRLRMQHVIEKEKLVLSVEQEILRVHGRAARALANQALPFSACTILKDEEVYNVITPEQEEKDRNARSRYNGRLFLSWLQDVDDKWEKIKESMLLRHHNEAESLHAVQKMDWNWKLIELTLCEVKSKPVIDEHHVPMVLVSDDFDLLPA